MYEYCGNQQALEVCRKFADWVIARNDKLSDEQMQKMLGTEHGGMCEVLANLYGVTGEEKYLKIAQRFNHRAIIGPASNEEDKLTGLHANTQIPKFIGAARQYELTGDKGLQTAASFFWDKVVNERSYVIGGNSDKEGFTRKESLSKALGEGTCETCNTYNMLKLTRHLFCLGSQARVRRLLRAGPVQPYPGLAESPKPACCATSFRCNPGRENTTAGRWIRSGAARAREWRTRQSTATASIFTEERDLYVNLFIASELNWNDKGLKLLQETKYPDEASSKLAFTCDETG